MERSIAAPLDILSSLVVRVLAPLSAWCSGVLCVCVCVCAWRPSGAAGVLGGMLREVRGGPLRHTAREDKAERNDDTLEAVADAGGPHGNTLR